MSVAVPSSGSGGGGGGKSGGSPPTSPKTPPPPPPPPPLHAAKSSAAKSSAAIVTALLPMNRIEASQHVNIPVRPHVVLSEVLDSQPVAWSRSTMFLQGRNARPNGEKTAMPIDR